MYYGAPATVFLSDTRKSFPQGAPVAGYVALTRFLLDAVTPPPWGYLAPKPLLELKAVSTAFLQQGAWHILS